MIDLQLALLPLFIDDLSNRARAVYGYLLFRTLPYGYKSLKIDYSTAGIVCGGNKASIVTGLNELHKSGFVKWDKKSSFVQLHTNPSSWDVGAQTRFIIDAISREEE